MSGLAGTLRRHRTEIGVVVLLVLGALLVRLAFYSSAPPFLNPDSAGYYVPARNLVYGDGFDLGLRRTPTYPLFIAAVVTFVGEDLQALVTVQHAIFGPLLAALTYLLGRLLTGRVAAAIAAAMVAISGPLLLYEHYVMTEVPFSILLLGLLCAAVLAVRRSSIGWTAVAGLLLGALILCRPSGQILVPILAGMLLLLMPGTWTRRAQALLVLAICTAVVVVPWMAYNWRTQGIFAVAGSGRFLLARTLKMDPGGFTFDPPPGVVEDPRRAAARQIVQQEAARTRPGSVAQRFRDELGLSDAEAYPLMQSFAIEAIRNRPAYFVSSTIEAFWEVMVGKPIDVRREGVPVADADFERRARAALRAPIYPLDAARAQAIVSIYDPARFGALVPILFALGTVICALRRELRWLLLPAVVTLALVGGSAALVGGELRYRTPQDPLILLVIAGSVAGLATMATGVMRRRRARESHQPARGVTSA